MSEERESLRLVAYNYEPEFTEEEMQNMTTKTPVNNELRKNVCAVVVCAWQDYVPNIHFTLILDHQSALKCQDLFMCLSFSITWDT
jgi:hypothetical protein